MRILFREMKIEDYEQAYLLWTQSPGIGLSADDDFHGVAKFLDRNPGCSFVALDGDVLIGAALAGYDGRRGYLSHVAVQKNFHHQGIGTLLVQHCIDALLKEGIAKCHIIVYIDNKNGAAFWEKTGWFRREDLILMSRYTAK